MVKYNINQSSWYAKMTEQYYEFCLNRQIFWWNVHSLLIKKKKFFLLFQVALICKIINND